MIAPTGPAVASDADHSAGAGEPNPTADVTGVSPTEKAVSGSARTDAGPADANLPDDLPNDDLPSAETLRKIEGYAVLDRHGKTHAFKSLYSGPDVARRVLVVFVRHFYCGSCSMFLSALEAAGLTPEALLALPISTGVAVVGCGDPGLIDLYAERAGCRFPIYADPTGRLHGELGLAKTNTPGPVPAYVTKSYLRLMVEGLTQMFWKLGSGLATKGGDYRQNGGEFLFGPASAGTPPDPAEGESPAEEKTVTWCHRMRNTQDHTEVPELSKVLGFDE